MNRRQMIACLPAGIVLATVAGNLALSSHEEGDEVDVRDFGVVGDGVADDSEALSRAFESDFRRLIFPPGTYRFTNVPFGIHRDVVIDASQATFLNSGNGTPLFHLGKAARLVRGRFHLGAYESGAYGGVLFDIDGGLVADCNIEIDLVRLVSDAGGIIRHHSAKEAREFTEGVFFCNVVGLRWDSRENAGKVPMIDISSGFNSFSACNFSVRDVRLLSGAMFMRAICSSNVGSSFTQVRLHDISVEKAHGGFVHFEGMRMSGLSNIGFFDLKGYDIGDPLITAVHAEYSRNSGGCYANDIFRARAHFVGRGCDVYSDDRVIELRNYQAVNNLRVVRA